MEFFSNLTNIFVGSGRGEGKLWDFLSLWDLAYRGLDEYWPLHYLNLPLPRKWIIVRDAFVMCHPLGICYCDLLTPVRVSVMIWGDHSRGITLNDNGTIATNIAASYGAEVCVCEYVLVTIHLFDLFKRHIYVHILCFHARVIPDSLDRSRALIPNLRLIIAFLIIRNICVWFVHICFCDGSRRVSIWRASAALMCLCGSTKIKYLIS